jgi:hypothetical protein
MRGQDLRFSRAALCSNGQVERNRGGPEAGSHCLGRDQTDDQACEGRQVLRLVVTARAQPGPGPAFN